MNNHDADITKNIDWAVTDGDWQAALEGAEELEEGAEAARAAVLAHFSLVPCPECDGQSDGDMLECPCCESLHFVDDVDLTVWRRSPQNPANFPHYWEPEAA